MKLNVIVGTAILLVSSLAMAQATQMQIKPLEVTPPVAAQPATTLQAQPAQLELNTEEAQLKRRVAELERENAELQKSLQALTALGGSNVHAYCPAGSPELSRSTSGGENNCGEGGYKCDPVSGLCRDSCTSSDQCFGDRQCSDNKCRTLKEIHALTGQES